MGFLRGFYWAVMHCFRCLLEDPLATLQSACAVGLPRRFSKPVASAETLALLAQTMALQYLHVACSVQLLHIVAVSILRSIY